MSLWTYLQYVCSLAFRPLKVFSTRVQHWSRAQRTEAVNTVNGENGAILGQYGLAMTRVFNYFTARRDREGCVETTERTVGVHGVGAIYIFSQYSSHSSAVSSVERNTPSLIPLFLDLVSLSLSPFSLSCSPSSHEYRFHDVSLNLAYLLPDSTVARY